MIAANYELGISISLEIYEERGKVAACLQSLNKFFFFFCSVFRSALDGTKTSNQA